VGEDADRIFVLLLQAGADINIRYPEEDYKPAFRTLY
jgi:hypothetical protein